MVTQSILVNCKQYRTKCWWKTATNGGSLVVTTQGNLVCRRTIDWLKTVNKDKMTAVYECDYWLEWVHVGTSYWGSGISLGGSASNPPSKKSTCKLIFL